MDTTTKVLLLLVVALLGVYMGPNFLKSDNNNNLGVPVVNCKAGSVKGAKLTSRDGRGIFAYRGMPYAKPPLGKLRFLPSQPLDKAWEGVHDGTQYSKVCMQPKQFFSGFTGDEDCLTLNVYVPELEKGKTKGDQLLPVMFWIHGGAFVLGDTNEAIYGPSSLLDKDVIMVSVQYRLGPLGALNIGNSDIASGNQALWDQRLAMMWVQQNIESFGGDPKRVTIFGESAGSMSVMYHMVSTASNQGLFHAAIAMSGSPHSAFLGMDRERSMVDFHKEYINKIGCSNDLTPKDLAKCLQDKPVDQIMKESFMFDQCNFFEGLFSHPIPWKPTSDAEYTATPFFSEEPTRLLQEGKMAAVPLMIGYTKDEGLLSMAFLARKTNLQEKLKNEWEQCMVHQLLAKRYDDIKEKDIELLSQLEDFYFDGKRKEEVTVENSFENLTNIFTDFMFGYSTDLAVRSAAKRADSKDVFYYHFDHVGSFSIADMMGRSLPSLLVTLAAKYFGYHTTVKWGACHADDNFYIFSSPGPLKMLSDPLDEDMSRLMVDLWTNFATFHHPTPMMDKEGSLGNLEGRIKQVWKPVEVGSNSPNYAILKDSKLTVEKDEEVERRISFLRNKLKL